MNSDFGDAIGNRNTAQVRAIPKQPVREVGDAVGQSDTAQIPALLECTTPDVDYAVGNRNSRQTLAIQERLGSDVGNAVGRDIASTFALGELHKNVCALVEEDTIYTAIKRIGCVHRYRAQAGTMVKSVVPNGSNAIGDADVGQV